MKTSTLVLSFCGFCILYISNADWIDELYEKFVEGYLITDYEEVAPFVSSVAAGTEEFDKLLEEFNKSKEQWYHFSPNVLLSIFSLTIFSCIFCCATLSKEVRILKIAQRFLNKFWECKNSIIRKKEEFEDVGIMEIYEKKYKNGCGELNKKDDVPVKLLWKGGTLVESSIHCNIKDDLVDSKILNMQKHLLQSTLLLQCSDIGGGDKNMQLSQSSSDESTALKIAEICKLLESEPEIITRFVELKEKQNDFTNIKKREKAHKIFKNSEKLSEECFSSNKLLGHMRPEEKKNLESKYEDGRENLEKCNKKLRTFEEKQEVTEIEENDKEERGKSEWDGSPDPRLMNRIRLLESRLRLEELKNKNWIKRMSRAEGILHQLNKQIGIPFSKDNSKLPCPMVPTPSIPIPLSPNIKPQYLFLSKYMSK